MTNPQKPSKVALIVAFTVMAIFSLMFLVYALVQRQEALKMRQMAYETQNKLLNDLVEAERKLKECENSK